MRELLQISALVAEATEASPWLTHDVPRRVELLLADQDPHGLSELGALGLSEEIKHAARTANAALLAFPAVPPPIDAVVVGGLPRTGTTYLQSVLGEALGRRLLRGWEAYLPSAASNPELRAGAIAEARARFAAARSVSPELHEMHPLDADGIEECTPLLQHSLECLQWAMMLHAPSYVKWLLAPRRTTAYRIWGAQLNQIGQSGTRWLLKSPMHFCDYRSMLSVAPGCSIIHVRRDPVSMITSFLNLCLSARRVFNPRVVPAGLGKFWLTQIARFLDAAQQDIDDLGLHIVVVDFPDLLIDPYRVVGFIAEELGVKAIPYRDPPRPPSASYRRLPLEAFGLQARYVQQRLGDHLGGPFLLDVHPRR